MDNSFYLFLGLGMVKPQRPEITDNLGIVSFGVEPGAKLVFFEETPENQLTAEARLRLFEEIERAKKSHDEVRCTLYLGCNLPSAKQLREIAVLLREDSGMNNNMIIHEAWRLWTCDCNLAKKAVLLDRVFPWKNHALVLPCGELPLSTVKVYQDYTYHRCTRERISQIEVLKSLKSKPQLSGRRRYPMC